ncbi:MAG TPA: cation:dicarboxylase symporter family transporter [Terriglobia bacterium]|nr:cation:dicarboxylase symporter family transporter [Terriglobia bacterium]
MSFSKKILLGLIFGVAVGLFFGERIAFLGIAAEGYVKLLQVTVLPYITVSLIAGLGSLSSKEARILGMKVGVVVVLLWLVGLALAFLFPLAFPELKAATFFSTTIIQKHEPFDFLALYIPANPFHSLANNVVPAVVLFSMIMGIALIGIPQKKGLLDLLTLINQVISRATRLIVRSTPYGLFAIAATQAGTLDLAQLERLQVYIVTYLTVALLVSLWVLPGLVAALTPLRYWEILSALRDALITAFMTSSLFIVLPILMDQTRKLLTKHSGSQSQAGSLPEVIVPASFNFPHTGKLLSLSFILFAGWFANAPVASASYPTLALTGLLTSFGSLNSAIPYLLDLFKIPADTFQLFLATGPVNAAFGTLVAAMHTATVALLGSFALLGLLRIDRRRMVNYVVVTILLIAGSVGGARLLFSRVLRMQYDKDKVIANMQLLHESERAVTHRTPPVMETQNIDPSKPMLEVIRKRGALRVGYFPTALPYSYFNASGDLVGFDVEMAHKLASELNLRLEFVPVVLSDRGSSSIGEDLGKKVDGSYCDIVMSGVPLTTELAASMRLSNSYLDETLSFIVPDHRRTEFETWDAIRGIAGLKVGVPELEYYARKARMALPNATVIVLPNFWESLKKVGPELDAFIAPAERGSVMTLLNPEYTVVVPQPEIIKIPLAYPIARQDEGFANLVNTWIELKKKDGTIEGLYNYWILGKNARPKQPRWSVIHDVLHWSN